MQSSGTDMALWCGHGSNKVYMRACKRKTLACFAAATCGCGRRSADPGAVAGRRRGTDMGAEGVPPPELRQAGVRAAGPPCIVCTQSYLTPQPSAASPVHSRQDIFISK